MRYEWNWMGLCIGRRFLFIFCFYYYGAAWGHKKNSGVLDSGLAGVLGELHAWVRGYILMREIR
jgi:hypothetical protein